MPPGLFGIKKRKRLTTLSSTQLSRLACTRRGRVLSCAKCLGFFMAKKAGRRSAADLAAPRFIAAMQPTRKLRADELRVWDRVIGSWPRDHWIHSDAETLTQYCAICVAFDLARKRDDLSAMEKAGRLSLSYATKLRITPQSRYDWKGAHREANRGRQNEASSERLLGGVETWKRKTTQ